MSLNVTGYPLEFDAKVNTDGLTAGAKSVKDNLTALTDPLKAGLNAIDNSLADLITNMRKLGSDPALESLFTKYADLQKQELTFKDSISKATDPTQITAYNDQLSKVHDQMKAVADEVGKLAQASPPLNEASGVDKTVQAYTRLRQIKNELAQMSIDGGRGTEEYEKLNSEAIKLQNALRNTNKELSLAGSNVAGITALQESVRGVVGAFEAVSGAVTLFDGDSKEADEATKKVIGAMGILNGLEEIASLLAKDSAVNFYLEGLMHKSAAVATEEHAAAAGTLAVAEGAQATATEGAVVAQEELNVAMLANPVGIILASIVALYGAYLIYANTLGKATDAEVREKAARESMDEANLKSIDSVAKEQSAIESLLVTLKDENISKAQKEQALSELSAKYPEYLGQLTLENSLTDKGNQLINSQLDLIKKKAFAAASEDLYTESLKEQMKVQTELNRIKAGGEITTGESFHAIISDNQRHTGALGFTTQEDLTATAIKDLEDKLKDLKDKSAGVFDTMADGSKALAESFQSDQEKILAYIKSLDLLISKSDGVIKSMLEMALAGQKLKLQSANVIGAFDSKLYDEESKRIKENAQLQVDLNRNSFDAKKKLIQDTYDLELGKINQTLSGDAAKQATKVLYGKFISQITQLDEEYRQKKLQADVDAANATSIALQAAGRGSSDAYFDARIKAIKAASEKELDAARFNAESTKQIYAKLNLDLIQNELDRQKSILQARIDGNEAELLLVTKGSRQELDLKIANIILSSQKELDVIGLTEEKKKEIRIKSEKDVTDAVNAFRFQQDKDNSNVVISNIQAQIDIVKKGTSQELSLQQQMITAKQRLSIIDEENSTDAERVKIAKIDEINKKAYADRLILESNFIKSMLDLRNQAIEETKSRKNADLDLIINDVTSSFSDKAEAERQKLQNNYDALQREVTNTQNQLTVSLLNPNGEDAKLIDDLIKKLELLESAAKAAHLLIDNDDSKNKGLEKASLDVDKLANSFKELADGARDLDGGLFQILGTLSQMTTSVKVAIDSFKDFQAESKKDNPDITALISSAAGIAGAVVGVVSTVINFFRSAHDTRIQAEKELKAYNDSLITGQTEYNILIRQQALSQQDINDLSIAELETRKKLLSLQKQQAQSDYDALLKQIQLEGQQITGEHTEKHGGILGIGRKTKVVQDLADLGNTDYNNLLKLFTEGKLDAATSKWFQELQKVHDELDAIGVSAQDAIDAENQKATGTTASAIADSIEEGFAQGKRSASDFGDNFQSIMQKSILDSFKFNALEEPIKKFYDEFAATVEKSQGAPSQSQIQQLQQQYNAIISNAGIQFDQLQKLTHIDLTSAGNDGNSLKGAIKGITEQQADVLAGQFGGLRITALEQLNIAKSSFTVLGKIENNTSRLAAVEGYLRKFDQQGIKLQ